MRLTPTQHQQILQATRLNFGANANVWLFGSRVDDSRRGGDVDLYVETDQASTLLSASVGVATQRTRIVCRQSTIASQRRSHHGHGTKTLETRQTGHTRRQYVIVKTGRDVPARAMAGLFQQGQGLQSLGFGRQRIH